MNSPVESSSQFVLPPFFPPRGYFNDAEAWILTNSWFKHFDPDSSSTTIFFSDYLFLSSKSRPLLWDCCYSRTDVNVKRFGYPDGCVVLKFPAEREKNLDELAVFEPSRTFELGKSERLERLVIWKELELYEPSTDSWRLCRMLALAPEAKLSDIWDFMVIGRIPLQDASLRLLDPETSQTGPEITDASETKAESFAETTRARTSREPPNRRPSSFFFPSRSSQDSVKQGPNTQTRNPRDGSRSRSRSRSRSPHSNELQSVSSGKENQSPADPADPDPPAVPQSYRRPLSVTKASQTFLARNSPTEDKQLP